MLDTVYKINIYTIVEESSDVQIESKELHEKVGPCQIEYRHLFSMQVILLAGALNMFTEEMDRSGSKMSIL